MAGDEFAGLLKELKERSGLSYGTLGKRLHMSASTLHRYVNGEAVPADYAPVERFARVCRATPEELVELHRRWVRADALRGQKGAPEPAVASAVAVPEPEVEAASGTEGAPEPDAASGPKMRLRWSRTQEPSPNRRYGVGVPSCSPVPPWPRPSWPPRSS
uniref:HTH cro/C1-type domain-containing protein n=1 Tax=Streptomyces avermitilis TaxID=33903 RepID=A0A499VGU4_STRAX|nr:hypothetical protein SAVMC3_54310 [Streptomyces avermitilis]